MVKSNMEKEPANSKSFPHKKGKDSLYSDVRTDSPWWSSMSAKMSSPLRGKKEKSQRTMELLDIHKTSGRKQILRRLLKEQKGQAYRV